MQRTAQLGFGLLVLIYLGLGILYATRTPAWQSPDEPAHYNYVRQLADGQFPLMEAGDYDQEYQSTVISSRFDPQYSIESFEYEDYQPPLYYLLLTPSYWLGNGSITALRLTSVLIGLGIVTLAFLTAQNVFPDKPWVALTVAAFVALLPQHLSLLSSVNNDALAELLIATMLYVITRPLGKSPASDSHINTRQLAFLLGLAFLTKVTAYLMAGAIGLYLLWRYWGDWRQLWQQGVRLFVPALLIGLIWWGRNVIVYPGPDFLGTVAHDAVVVGQPTTGEWVAQFGTPEVLRRFFRTSFQSFYGQFGWMCCPLPSWGYFPLRIMTILGIAGAVGWLWRFRPKSTRQQHLLIIFGSLLGLNLLLYLAYNLRFVQHQGRYLFASLVPIGVAMAAGLNLWLTPLTQRTRYAGFALPLTITLGFTFLNLYTIFFILPCGLAFGGC